MLFITDNKDKTINNSVITNSDLLKGLRILKDLVGHVRRPVNIIDEEYALKVLAALPNEDQFDEVTLSATKDLYADMSRIGQAELYDLIKWIYPWQLSVNENCGWRKRKGLRHLLLFILLARITAPLYEFRVIPELDALGLCPEKDDCYILLNWLPRRFVSNRKYRISRLYIDLTLQAWYGDIPRPNNHISREISDEFHQLPPQRQILELMTWNRRWQIQQKDEFHNSKIMNPTVSVGTVEFLLSRKGIFQKLKTSGGSIIKTIVEEMNYKDFYVNKFFPLKTIIRSILIIAAAAVILSVNFYNVKKRHESNEQAITQLTNNSIENLKLLQKTINDELVTVVATQEHISDSK